ncbi:hypothetical protein [Roseococcus suduntuyensis]|uniref:Enoyl-CoA hydratase/carnithine racemase n=1 Tax=Roseococcus suduntuyensis TaxID=455361 RepID=A0A840ADJ1_9PROT|nr:hypothetical protein [Roseococcus suduntuyensis]MBB3898440.1 enoyl-CoA hydratase/carnithine racemase [Roseococcus suduntuyensis]
MSDPDLMAALREALRRKLADASVPAAVLDRAEQELRQWADQQPPALSRRKLIEMIREVVEEERARLRP